jgi:hypothetical protein
MLSRRRLWPRFLIARLCRNRRPAQVPTNDRLTASGRSRPFHSEMALILGEVWRTMPVRGRILCCAAQ